MMIDPRFREVYPPITNHQLKHLDRRCERVQFHSLLSNKDFLILANFLRDYPDVGLRVYGNYDKSITNLSFLKYFPYIKKFGVDLWELTSLDELAYLSPNLIKLEIGKTHSKRNSLRILTKFPSLETLILEGSFKDFQTVGQLTNLENLTLRSISQLDLSILTTLPQLKSLKIKLGSIKDFTVLPHIGKIRYLELWLIRGLTDITPVAEVISLQYLFLQALKHVEKIPSLNKLPALRRLHIETLKGLYDLTPINTAPALEELIIVDMHQLNPDNFRSFIGHPTLKSAIIGLGSVKKNKAVQEMLKLPRVKSDKFGFIFL